MDGTNCGPRVRRIIKRFISKPHKERLRLAETMDFIANALRLSVALGTEPAQFVQEREPSQRPRFRSL